MAGFKSEEIEAMNIASISDEELQQIIRGRLLGEDPGDCKQKVVSINSLEKYLDEGWEYVATLQNGKVIVKMKGMQQPSGTIS